MKKPFSPSVVVYFIGICLLFLPVYSNAQAAGLDMSFGTGGKVTTPIGPDYDVGNSLVIQPDGKLVVSGFRAFFPGSGNAFGLIRYNIDGSLDTSFGTGGTVTTSIGVYDSYGNAMALQSDGKIVVAGGYNNGANTDFALIRYNADGSLDATFGTGGIVTTPIGTSEDVAFGVAIQTDGKIVAAGMTYNGSVNHFALIRYNSNGTLDLSFGTGGKVVTAVGTSEDRANTIVIQTDNKIVLAGLSYNSSSNSDFALVRYNTNGSLDTTFGVAGKVTTAMGNYDDIGYSAILQTDGKILLAGRVRMSAFWDFGLGRYNTDGSLDSAFGTNGKVITAFTNYDAYCNSVAVQVDGKIVLSGGSGLTSTTRGFALARYNNNGTPDMSFGISGRTTTAIGNHNDFGASVAIQSDGKIVVAGDSYNGTNDDFAIARYNGDFTTDVNASYETETDVKIYPNPTSNIFYLEYAKFNPNTSTFEIVNLLGETVYQCQINNSTTPIDFSSQSSGIYFYRVKEKEKTISSGKIIIQ